jgi:GDP-4-dehydro-6-deoxy-D-mannose reductase
VEWIEVDLRDRAEVHALLRETHPGYVVHLAAIALPREAAADPVEALRVNYGVVDALLSAMREQAPTARLLNVSTGEAYGARPEDSPALREDDHLRPPTPYSATKAAAEVRGLQAVEREGLDVITVRPLNHSGPGRPPQYAESAFARQVACIERGQQEPVLRVGNLEEIRDFSDVRDVVRAYALLLQRGERGAIYNVCSGRGWKLRAVLEHLIARAGIEPVIEVDPALYRAGDPERRALVGDPTKLRALGWAPRYRFEETLDDLLEDWRSRV